MKTTHKFADGVTATLERVEPESLSASTLKTLLMEITLEELKAANDVWHKLGEREQDDTINRIEKRVSDTTKRVLELFATAGISHVCATLESITVKDGIKGVVSLSRHDAQRHEVLDAQGQTVWLVLANPEQFTDTAHGHEADADQAQLDLDNALRKVGDGDAAQAD